MTMKESGSTNRKSHSSADSNSKIALWNKFSRTNRTNDSKAGRIRNAMHSVGIAR
jgi:hypothetical protein